MPLIPGILPSDTCYGKPQDLLDLFAQYLSIPAANYQTNVVFSTSSAGIATDSIWIDTTSAGTPILNLNISGFWVDYIYNYLTNRTTATIPLTSSDFIPVIQAGTVKKVASTSLPGLKVLQVVTSSTTSVVTINSLIPRDDSIPQNTEGVEILTLSITPQSASSTLYMEFLCFGTTDLNGIAQGAIFVDSVADAIYATESPRSTLSYGVPVKMSFFVPSVSTTARTYKVRLGVSGSNNFYVNANSLGVRLFGGVSIATFQITEMM